MRLNRLLFLFVVFAGLASTARAQESPSQHVHKGDFQMLVGSIDPGSPAEQAGLEIGEKVAAWSFENDLPNKFTTPFQWRFVKRLGQAPSGLTLHTGEGRVITLSPEDDWGMYLAMPFEGKAAELDRLAREALAENRWEDAQAYFHKAAGIEEMDAESRAWFLARAGAAALQAESFPVALGYFDQALAFHGDLSPWALATLFEDRSDTHLEMNADEKNLADAQEALLLMQQLLPGTLAHAMQMHPVARAHYYREEFQEALQHWQAMLELETRINPGSPREATAWHRAGLALNRLERFDEAVAAYQRELNIWLGLENSEKGQADALHNMAMVFRRQGKRRQAEELYERVIPLREKHAPDSAVLANAYNNYANVISDLGRLEDADPFYQKALAIRRKIDPDSFDVVASLNNLAVNAMEMGALDRALALYKECLQRLEALRPDSGAMVTVLNNTANVLGSKGKLLEAEEHRRRALAIIRKLAPGGMDEALTLGNLGQGRQSLGDLHNAMLLFQQAYDLAKEKAPNGVVALTALNGLAVCHRKLDQHEEAIGYLEKAYSAWGDNAPRGPERLTLLIEIGNIHLKVQDLEKAEATYLQALQWAQEDFPGRTHEASILNNLSVLDEQKGDWKAMESHARGAIAIKEKTGPVSLTLATSYGQRAIALYHLGKKDEAFLVMDQAVGTIETLLKWTGASEDVRGAILRQGRDLFAFWMKLLVETGQTDQALALYQRHRTFLAENLFAAKQWDLLRKRTPAQVERWDRLHHQYQKVLQELQALGPQDEAAQGLLETLDRLEAERAALKQTLREEFPIPLGEALPLAPPSPGTLRLFLMEGEGFVVTLLQKPQGLQGRVVEISGLPARVRRLRAQWQSRADAGEAEGWFLDHLLRPLNEGFEGVSRIELVVDGQLNFLAFAPLMKALGHNVPVVRLGFSGPMEAGGTGNHLLAMGVSTLPEAAQEGDHLFRSQSLGPLPAAKKEVLGLQKKNKRAGRLLLDKEATVDRFFLEAPKATIIHLAAHGLVDPVRPLHSRLQLYPGEKDDGSLYAWDIIDRLELKADLVVLSACETGLGMEAGGEGLLGLQSAFAYAGARSVLVSLWPIDDEGTAVFMEHFYGFLLSGKGKAESLFLAQQAMQDSETYSAPFYWAGFVLIGEG